jgi:hypothetical protein
VLLVVLEVDLEVDVVLLEVDVVLLEVDVVLLEVEVGVGVVECFVVAGFVVGFGSGGGVSPPKDQEP